MADPALAAALAQAITAKRRECRRPVLIGISGVQGSGKSTLCAQLEAVLATHGLAAVTLSLDDLYLTHAQRAALAASVHPLFATRGVPGTHDLALAEATLDLLLEGQGQFAVPRFDKAHDDRADGSAWPVVLAPVDVVLFEGWCIGATPQEKSALATPINALEAEEDPDLTWRSHANNALGNGYARLFARLDQLIILRAPGFSVVRTWRHQQEAALKAGPGMGAGMDPPSLDRFIAHFERLSRHMLATAPPKGSVIVDLDSERRVCALSGLPCRAPGE